jgi:hypothetical protein
MSYVIAAPEMMAAAATDLAGIGSTLTEEHTAAAALTVGLVPAAADEVSAAVAHLFSQHAANYHATAAQAAAFSDQFVQHLTAGAFSYASAEAAIDSLLNDLQPIAAVILFVPGVFVVVGLFLLLAAVVTLERWRGA